MKKKIPKPYRYDLWKFFSDNHKLTLLESELNDIVYAVNKQLDIEQKTTEKDSDYSSRLDYEQTRNGLKYISESPELRFGGFHPATIQIAKSSLYHLDWMEQEIHHERAKNFCLSPEVKRAQDKIRELRVEIETIRKSMA